MASPKGDRREQLRAAAVSEVERWERLLADELTALWSRQEGVVLVRLQGTKARKHTRHWTPAPAAEAKALDPRYIVDVARWVLQAVGVVSELLRRLYEDVILTVFKQLGFLLDSGVFKPAAAPEQDVPDAPAADDLPAPARTAVRDAARDAAQSLASRVERADEGPRQPDAEDGPTVPTDVVEAHLRARIETIARGVAEAAEEVQDVIAKAEADDKPMPEIVDTVRDTYRNRSKTWTSKVVNSNVVGAMNESSLMAATAAGVAKKQWLAAHDQRTRDSHVKADGTIVDIDADFDLDGGSVAYPGDPSGPIGEVINCRCTLLFPMPGLPVYDPAKFAKALPVYASAAGGAA